MCGIVGTMGQKLILNQLRGFLNSQRLFMLVIFELWRREYKIQCNWSRYIEIVYLF